MKFHPLLFSFLGLCAMSTAMASAPDTPAGVLRFKVPSIDGAEVGLSERYTGKVILIVNVPAEGGATEFTAHLTALREKYGSRGLAVLALPTRDFNATAKDQDEAPRAVERAEFGAGIDVSAPVSVGGEGQLPLYTFLTSKELNPHFGGDIRANYTRFLIGRDGNVLGRFEADAEASELNDPIEAALEAPSNEDGDDWETLSVGDVTAKAEL